MHIYILYRGNAGVKDMQLKELTFVKNLQQTEQVEILSEIDGNDGFKYGLIKTKNPMTGAEYLFVIKYTYTGYTKSIMRLPVGVAKTIANAILERVK